MVIQGTQLLSGRSSQDFNSGGLDGVPALNHYIILPNRAVTLKEKGKKQTNKKERGRLTEGQISGKRQGMKQGHCEQMTASFKRQRKRGNSPGGEH